MNVTAIIVAAGRGVRAGGNRPKQWQPLAGSRVIDHTISTFLNHPGISRIVLVVHPEDRDLAAQFEKSGVVVCDGGDTRSASVSRGLAKVSTEMVLIHDAARPCVSRDVIDGVLDALNDADAAAPGLPVTDALWRGRDGEVVGTQDRDGLFAAQTPQGFRLSAITKAHRDFGGAAADDVEIARAAGLRVVITPGNADNLKITTPADFARAARILESRLDIRTGNGFDVHAFGPGDHVMLCGVMVPHNRGLVGHSDADVGLHTITDAIYGALAKGDIGQHFPPSDEKWKGAESHVFLRHAGTLARELGYRISNLDCTLICEEPKIGPHANAMRQAVADILEIEEDQVSVKATTSERLGFTGRKEGIACMATATLMKP